MKHMKKGTVAIIVAVIGIVPAVLALFIGENLGYHKGETITQIRTIEKLNGVQSIEANNVTVNYINGINDYEAELEKQVDEKNEYQDTIAVLSEENSALLSENERLKQQISSLEKALEQEHNPDNNVKEIVRFGRYQQDSNSTNLKEIEWRVLDKQDGRYLLISEYGLDARAFNPSFDTTWENSEIRDWLNHDFLETAFTDSERALIQKTFVSSDSNAAYNTNQGNSTWDYIFLLSAKEAAWYFNNNKDRQCTPTQYANEQADYEDNEGLTFCWWWLRTMGENNDKAVLVTARKGDIVLKGDGVHFTAGTVRPAMWVKWIGAG